MAKSGAGAARAAGADTFFGNMESKKLRAGFAGAGRMNDSLGGHGEDETIPSYGLGIRFMVLESQRINVRVDYARSNKGNAAWYLSVTEAF